MQFSDGLPRLRLAMTKGVKLNPTLPQHYIEPFFVNQGLFISEGLIPKWFLKARLKEYMDLKPTVTATEETLSVFSSFFASSIRLLLRYAVFLFKMLA